MDVSWNRDVSLQNKQSVKTFFGRSTVFVFLEQTQDFLVAVSGATRGKGQRRLQPSLAKSLRKFNPKILPFKSVLDLTGSKGSGTASQVN